MHLVSIKFTLLVSFFHIVYVFSSLYFSCYSIINQTKLTNKPTSFPVFVSISLHMKLFSSSVNPGQARLAVSLGVRACTITTCTLSIQAGLSLVSCSVLTTGLFH